jgi:hypothetical protein
MFIEFKLIVTLILIWIIIFCSAYPSTKFAKWGEKKFESYGNFLSVITKCIAIPIVLIAIIWIWRM